ncbi:hypothetical protein GCM10011492_39240 [Flexivirga endophytica]|uniref:WxL domain-containing protein n=1 Tax=Flexivirga endophytica TaxID=1849103 RepID=A0A916WZ36_9MICO|nr:hypothetical protein [Flexivirga endophytica]GGB44313.1 hypothetical protein GCM10011492_39240 [Flexivirga endophytica]GHB60218.1 hypothetical protein GCM10008112_31440 [Flexivirga endophytica]
MNRSKNIRLVGFVSALGVSAALVAAASSGTGAYFTDSASGHVSGTSGSLALSTGPTAIDFTGLNPGVDKSQKVDFSVKSGSTTNADIWLVFDASTAGYGNFTGATDAGGTAYDGVTGGGLGQYGHFKLASPAGNFESYNLQLPTVADATQPYTSTGSANTCTVNKYGHGGSSTQHTVGDGTDIAECGVPAAILLKGNLAPGVAASATITFGITGKAQTQNTVWANVGYKIVATQPGVAPTGPTW